MNETETKQRQKPGRKPVYRSDAERAAAYRARKAAKQAQAWADMELRALAVPTVIEKPVEKIVERVVPANVQRFAKAVGEGFRRQRRSEREGQRLKTNATKMEGALIELMDLARDSGRSDLEGELKAMGELLAVVRSIAPVLEHEKVRAAAVASQREVDFQKRHAAAVNAAMVEIFGADGRQRDPLAFARSLLDFEAERDDWGRRKGYGGCIIEGLTSEGRETELRAALKAENHRRCAQIIAEIKLGGAAKGSLFDANNRRTWFAGWDDIESWWLTWQNRLD